MDPIVLLASLLMFAAAGGLGFSAYRLDRRLRHLLPWGIARRWSAQFRPPSHDLGEQIRFYFPRLFPAHWQAELHSDAGALLVRQLHLVLGLACCSTMVGLTLLSRGIAPAH